MNINLQSFLFAKKWKGHLEDLAKLMLRLLFGLSLALNHGWPTLKAAIGSAADFPDPLGLGPELTIFLVGSAEFACAIFVVAGFLTRIFVIPIVFNFAVAFFIFHSGESFGDKELAYLYLSAMIIILILGPGKYSLDYKLFQPKKFTPADYQPL